MTAFTGKHNNYRITIEEVNIKEDRELQTMQFEIEDRENIPLLEDEEKLLAHLISQTLPEEKEELQKEKPLT